VDKLWSVVPFVDMWIYYAASGSPRVLLMAVLATLWGVRLSTNFALKGGFSGGEDYRWVEVKSWFTSAQFEVFNLVFVCGFQLLLLLFIAAPAAVAAHPDHAAAPLTALDYGLATLFALLLLGEARGTQQAVNLTETASVAGWHDSVSVSARLRTPRPVRVHRSTGTCRAHARTPRVCECVNVRGGGGGGGYRACRRVNEPELTPTRCLSHGSPMYQAVADAQMMVYQNEK